ncbi:ATP-binding protein [Azohydromonas lata]|uniref:histidine kinase n=1 Tax=Azohydromonas lata TaxID=45677 RepID=A0ABU5IM81_9BURK|nr:ATP-binding protein [Azohydromonas lata]MDZ5459999.1 ATP-binding protein [Azohydromonas lata]
MKLRSHVIVLVLLTMLPMLALTTGLIYWNARIQRQSVERGMQQTVAAMAYALDEELQVTIAALQALTVDAEEAGLTAQALQARVEAVCSRHPGWASVVLAKDDGSTVIPLSRSSGPAIADDAWRSAAHALDGGRPAVSEPYASKLPGTDATAIHVPVGARHPGASLAAVIPGAHWVRFLQERLIPAGWVAGIIDGEGIVIARSRAAERYVGKPAPAWVRDGARTADFGQLAGPSFEGQPLSLVFHRSAVSGWTVAFAAPTEVFEQPLRQSLRLTLLCGLGFVTVAGVLALLYARRIVRPITELMRSSSALGRFERLPALPDTAVQEINHLYRTLAQASEDMAAAAVARSRAQEGERHAMELAQAAARQHRLELHAQQSEHASTRKSQFLATMSHEMRTPLHAILGTAQILERTVQDGSQLQLVGSLRVAGQSLLAQINDVLDLARIESGKVELELGSFLLSKVLGDAVDALMPTAQEKGLQLTLEPLPAGLLRPLRGDARRLGQVIYNLVGNALKFTDQGQVCLGVQSLRENERRVELRLWVRDTGIGIAADETDRIFDAFEQADGAADRRHGGTGLGLAISRQIILLMGGEIGVHSRQGEGSEFWLHLPFQLSAEPLPATAALAPKGARLAGLHVLLVDDMPANLDIARHLLAFEGASCATASHGQEALQRLSAAPAAFDVVLMDVQMPGLDGIEATRRLRAEPLAIDVPVIALTAGALPPQRERALQAGMNDFLAKPLELEDLVACILRCTAQLLRPKLEVAPTVASDGGDFPVIAGIDRAQVQGRFMGDRRLFLRMLCTLRDEYADAPRQWRADIHQGDFEAAAGRVHRLVGLAGNLSAARVVHQAKRLELALRELRVGSLVELLDNLEQALGEVLAAMPTDSEDDAPASGARGDQADQVGSLPMERILALLDALQSNDMAALELFNGLRAQLQDRHGRDKVGLLAQALDALRFTTASALLLDWYPDARRPS